MRRIKRRPRPPVALGLKDVQQLVGNSNDPIRTMLIAGSCVGLRGSEMAGLKWGDFTADGLNLNLARGIVRQRVTNLKDAYVQLPLCSEVADCFRAWRSISPFNKNADWVFASSRSKGRFPCNSTAAQRQVQLLAQKLGIRKKIGWHVFRRTCASILLKMEVPISVVMALLRHKTMHATSLSDAHAHPSAGDLRRAMSKVARAVHCREHRTFEDKK